MSLLSEQADELRRAELSLAQHATSGVHDVRVATRRLRSLVRQARPWAGEETTRALRADLRWLAGALSEVRDAEVAEARIRTHLWSLTDPSVPPEEVASVEHALSVAHRTAYDAALAALATSRYPRLLRRLDVLMGTEPAGELGELSDLEAQTRAIRGQWRAMTGVAELVSPGDPEQLHDVRKRAKRLRYATESLVPLVGRDAVRFAEALKSVQALLGDHHDTVISRHRLAALDSEPGLAPTLARVRAIEEESAAALEEEFTRTWPLLTRRLAHRWPFVGGGGAEAEVYR